MASERFERNARTFTLLTLLSRLTGLVRDATLARAFGIGPVMDAFAFGFMVPNLFRRLFGEGALSAAFLPNYAKLEREDPARATRFAALTIVSMALVLNAIVLVAEVLLFWLRSGAPELALAGIAPVPMGSSAGGLLMAPIDVRTPRLGLELLMIMLPYMPLVCMVAVFGSVLQSHDRFAPTAASPIILNLVIVGTALGLYPAFSNTGLIGQSGHAMIVGASVVAAGVLQLAWVFAAARRCGFSFRGAPPPWRPGDAGPPLRSTLAKAVPMMLGLGVLQLNTFLDGLIASWPTVVGPTIFGRPFPLEEGAMAALGNAQRLYEFPLGVFGIAVASAIFPVLSRQANERGPFMATLRRGLRLVVFIGLPASVGLILVARPAVAAVLQGGRFTADDTARVAFILIGYAPAIWSYSMVNVLARAFYALGDTATPTKVSVGMVALNLALNVTLILTPLREAGLAWSTAACSVLQCALLMALLKRRVGGIVDRDVFGSWIAALMASVWMAIGLLAVRFLLPAQAPTWSGAVRELLVLLPVGILIFATFARVMGRPELRWALGRS